MGYAILEREKGTYKTIDVVCESESYQQSVSEYLWYKLHDFISQNTFNKLYQSSILEEYEEYRSLIKMLDSESLNYKDFKEEFERIINYYDFDKEIRLIEY